MSYQSEETCDIDPEKVHLLKKKKLCDNTDAAIVIISSWRGGEDWTPKMYFVLRKILHDADIPVIGDAPYIPPKSTGPKKNTITLEELEQCHLVFGTGRAAEVQAYLQEHPTNSFVILDDEDSTIGLPMAMIDIGYVPVGLEKRLRKMMYKKRWTF